jgi:hypothetical protein
MRSPKLNNCQHISLLPGGQVVREVIESVELNNHWDCIPMWQATIQVPIQEPKEPNQIPKTKKLFVLFWNLLFVIEF